MSLSCAMQRSTCAWFVRNVHDFCSCPLDMRLKFRILAIAKTKPYLFDRVMSFMITGDAVRQTPDQSSAVGIGREPQQWKGGKNGVALGSDHLACPVRRH